jgi:hypothetical protein
MILSMLRADPLPGRVPIAAAEAGGDLGRVAGKVSADDVQAELAQDRGGGLAFEEEFERCPDDFFGGDVTAPEAGGKSGGHAHLVAGARRCLNVEGATGLLGDGDLRHAVTLASRRSMRGWPGAKLSNAAPNRQMPVRCVGLFVPKPSCDARYQGRGLPDGRPSASAVVRWRLPRSSLS